MNRITSLLLVCGAIFICPLQGDLLAKVKEYPASGDYVVLLHGMLGLNDAMVPAAEYFQKKKYHAIVIPYPSTRISIVEATEQILIPAVRKHCHNPKKRIHFVGHSMGGLIIRHYLANQAPANLGRVVMIATPNQGNVLADIFADHFFIEDILGPAVQELKTQPSSLVKRLGPVNYDLGVIMGKVPKFLWLRKKNAQEHDLIVLVESGKVDGMNDFTIIKGMHASLKRSPEVIYQAYYFVKVGHFNDHPPREGLRKPSIFRKSKSPNIGPRSRR